MSAPRQAAPLQLALLPDVALRRACALLCLLSGAVLLAALASQSTVQELPWLPAWQWWALAVLLLPLCAWLGARLPGRSDQGLRWDGQVWWLLRAGAAQETAVKVRVAMDFGNWLLLRLRPADGPLPGLRSRYLALSRTLYAPQWPALRATLYTAPARQPEA